jgi:hypothetical protein
MITDLKLIILYIYSSYILLLQCRGFHFYFGSTHSVGLLGRVIGLSQGLYLSTAQHKHRINAHTHTHTHQTSMP